MNANLQKIKQFYDDNLGRHVYAKISNCLEKRLSNKLNNKNIVCSASSFPYFDLLKSARRLVLQSYAAQSSWPKKGAGHYIVNNRDAWPYRAEDIDLVLMAHDIEFAENPEAYLHEAWRVLKGEGHLIIIFPNRSGKWARIDNNPFGHGYPYTMQQMRALLGKCHFAIDRVDGALYFPAYQPKTKIAMIYRNFIDKIGEYCLFEPGVYVICASKHIYAPTKGLGATAKERAVGALFPKPSVSTKISKKNF